MPLHGWRIIADTRCCLDLHASREEKKRGAIVRVMKGGENVNFLLEPFQKGKKKKKKNLWKLDPNEGGLVGQFASMKRYVSEVVGTCSNHEKTVWTTGSRHFHLPRHPSSLWKFFEDG